MTISKTIKLAWRCWCCCCWRSDADIFFDKSQKYTINRSFARYLRARTEWEYIYTMATTATVVIACIIMITSISHCYRHVGKGPWLNWCWQRQPGPRLNTKIFFPGMISIIKIRRSWKCLIFILRISVLVTWHTHIETNPWFWISLGLLVCSQDLTYILSHIYPNRYELFIHTYVSSSLSAILLKMSNKLCICFFYIRT